MTFRFLTLSLISSLLPLADAGAKTLEVKIENIKFDPPAIVASSGDKIVWTNKDIVPHTVTSTKAGSFDSKMISPDQKWAFTVKKKGHFDYKCNFHPNMLGTIDVK